MVYTIYHGLTEFKFRNSKQLTEWYDSNRQYAINAKDMYIDIMSVNGKILEDTDRLSVSTLSEEESKYYEELCFRLMASLKILEDKYHKIYDPNKEYMDMSEFSNILINESGEVEIVRTA